MTDDTTRSSGSEIGSTTDDTFAWTEPQPAQGEGGAKAREWITQLQSMIENLATQAAPVVREVGAKAAELAAIAGDKAGPVAAKAAEMTGQAGQKLASKSRDIATDLRRDAAASRTGTETSADVADSISTDASASEEPTASGIV